MRGPCAPSCPANQPRNLRAKFSLFLVPQDGANEAQHEIGQGDGRPDWDGRWAGFPRPRRHCSKRPQREAATTQKAIEQVALSKEWVLARLIDNGTKALEAKEGSPVANLALELLGRELGMFIERLAS